MAVSLVASANALATGWAAIRGDRPFTVQVFSTAGTTVQFQFTHLPAMQATSADGMLLAKDDGTGFAYTAYSGGGNAFTAPIVPVTNTVRLLLSPATAGVRSFAIYAVQQS
jgi:hypothetical protein